MAEHVAQQERKDGLFLTDQEWHDLGSICQFWLETYRYVDRRTALAARIVAAALIDGGGTGPFADPHIIPSETGSDPARYDGSMCSDPLAGASE